MCDTMVSITPEGVLFAKNSDRDPNEAQVIEWHAASDHPEGSTLECTWITIGQARHTHAVVLSRPWWLWGAEIGANEHGVVIGNEAVFTRGLSRRGRGENDGLLGMDLLRLGLERSHTAEEAVSTIVELLERHGQNGSCSHEHPGLRYDNSFIVADPRGAIVLETAARSHATEVVRGRSRSISNGLTIAGFADAHADRLRGAVAQCALRRARTEELSGRARHVGAMFEVLRDHGEGPLPRYHLLNGALAAPCAHPGGLLTSTQSTSSWVADLTDAPRHWVTATSAPCTSIFKPVTVGDPVVLGPVPANTFDPASLWWRHELLHRRVMADPVELIGRFAAERTATEAVWLHDPPSTRKAFDTADAMERRWLADVEGYLASRRNTPDRRPPLVRHKWDRWNRQAGMPTAWLAQEGSLSG
jgi:dipeptidase